MRRHAVLLFALAIALMPAEALAADWDRVSGRPAPDRAGTPVEVRAANYAAFELDRGAVRDDLGVVGPAVVRVPAPDGTLQRFSVTEDPVLAPAAQRRFPSIRTYAATGIDDPTATARLDLTPLGFHASVRSADGLWYVDPRFKGEESVHMSYYHGDLIDRRTPLVEPEGALEGLAGKPSRAPRRAPGDRVTKRVYRLAIANSPAYATYFGGTDLLVESAKAVLVNRVNQLYNDDLAIRMEIVANNHLLNFDTVEEFDARFSSVGFGCDSDFITRNDAVLDELIGTTNYDIGHFVGGSDFNGGGIAGLGVVGGNSKGRGCTGLDPPVGDGFAIDYVAHEIGHQFGGPHTFDGNGNSNCASNRSTAGESAVEPGSGSSIQAYAGICGVEDLQDNSDPYFSQESIDDILTYVTSNIAGTEEGFIVTQIANRSPVVTAPAAATIPIRTPFTLAGSATDADGDGLVYMWEQDDLGGAAGHALLSPIKTDGPLFRQFSVAAAEDPLQSPAPGQNIAREVDKVRSFPDAAQVAADRTNAETGTCSPDDVTCFSEWLPTIGYTGPMNFRLTARDRNPSGGGLSVADTAISVAGAEPFQVTAPTAATLTGNDAVTVAWDVAGTDLAPFSAPDVRISYSIDGGLTFGYEVLVSTPNDGSESVVVPNIDTVKGRFKVEAIGNYFYDVSDGDLTVSLGPGATPSAAPTATPTPSAAPTVDPVTPGVPSATATATATATETATATATATAVPTASADPTATATSAYGIPTPSPTAAPTATPTPGPSVFPGRARLGPDLALVRRKLRPDAKGRIKISLRCKQLTVGTRPATCRGKLKLTYTRGGKQRKAAAKRFSFGSSQVGLVTLRLNRRALAAAKRGKLKGRITAKVGRRKAAKRVKIKRIR